MNRICLLGCLMLPLFFTSCKTKKQAKDLVEKTAFYTLTAIKDTVKNITTFKVTNIQVANSVLNKRSTDHQTHNPNFLYVQIIDQQKNIHEVYTEHPLYKRFDLYEESGEITSKSISLQQGDVTFRVPYYTNYKKIKISETVNFKTKKIIIIKNEN